MPVWDCISVCTYHHTSFNHVNKACTLFKQPQRSSGFGIRCIATALWLLPWRSLGSGSWQFIFCRWWSFMRSERTSVDVAGRWRDPNKACAMEPWVPWISGPQVFLCTTLPASQHDSIRVRSLTIWACPVFRESISSKTKHNNSNYLYLLDLQVWDASTRSNPTCSPTTVP